MTISASQELEHLAALRAVSRNPMALYTLPQRLKTLEVCTVAVHRWGWVLEAVPDHMRSIDLCQAAVQQCGAALQFVPGGLRTRALSMQAVLRQGEALVHVPAQLVDRELCLAAVRSEGVALRMVPDAWRDDDVCSEAVANTPWAVEYVSKAWLTAERARQVVSREGYLLSRVAERAPELLILEVCEAALRSNPSAWRWVPQPLLDQGLGTIEGVAQDMASERQARDEIALMSADDPTDDPNQTFDRGFSS